MIALLISSRVLYGPAASGHADRAILRQRKVLRVDEVHGDRGVRRVLEHRQPRLSRNLAIEARLPGDEIL